MAVRQFQCRCADTFTENRIFSARPHRHVWKDTGVKVAEVSQCFTRLYRSLGDTYDPLAKVGASGQLFHIITSSSKEPFRGVVARKSGLFQLVPYMSVSQCLMLDHLKKLQPERDKVSKTHAWIERQKVSALQHVSVQTLSQSLCWFWVKPQAWQVKA